MKITESKLRSIIQKIVSEASTSGTAPRNSSNLLTAHENLVEAYEFLQNSIDNLEPSQRGPRSGAIYEDLLDELGELINIVENWIS